MQRCIMSTRRVPPHNAPVASNRHAENAQANGTVHRVSGFTSYSQGTARRTSLLTAGEPGEP